MLRQSISSAWLQEAALLTAWLVVATGVGQLFGRPLAALCVALAVSLFVYQIQTYRLHRWLVRGRGDPPEGVAAWQEVAAALRRRERENRKRTTRLQDIVDEFEKSAQALPDGAVMIDPHGRIVWFNQASTVLLGLCSQRDQGQRIPNLLRHPRFAGYWVGGDPEQAEIEIPSPVDDARVVAVRITPYGNCQRLLIARDVTVQKKLDATRRDFVANASHELRTPLTVLQGYVEMMLEEARSGAVLGRWAGPIREMEAQTWRMSRLINDLLELASLENHPAETRSELVDVPAVIERVLAGITDTEVRNLNIEIRVDETLLLYGWKGELESIVSNLIQNAVQYTPEGGDVTVRWEWDADSACFAVTDSGIGIEASHIPRLTERFYRVDHSRTSATGGTGLGLSIVKHCLEHHDAELAIASESNLGSEFSCRFPHQRGHLRHAA